MTASRHASAPRLLLLTPPFVQLNTPYPATPSLAGFLRGKGIHVDQRDLSIEVALEVLRRYGDHPLIDTVIAFLQTDDTVTAKYLATPGVLPEGPAFESLAPAGTGLTREDFFTPRYGVVTGTDRAKLLCSLYLDDLAARIRDSVDPDFGFSRYAEHLGTALPSLSPLLARLRRRSPVDRILEEKTAAVLAQYRPTHVGVTCPFPGTLLGAFRIARVVRRLAPRVKLYLGGGYVSTELRFLTDPRVFDFFDALQFDEGYATWLGVLGKGPVVRTLTRDTLSRPLATGHQPPTTSHQPPATSHQPQATGHPPPAVIPPFVAPDYSGLDLSQYISLVEMANPMHRLWSDGRWLKLQLARGCYWHRCAFCDVKLDYIGRFAMPRAADVVDAMERLAAATGETGFHFTDEAIPPALARALSEELVRRHDHFRWWGNIRFDHAFTPALARLMARAGCIAVTGGLECANDRLLTLMSKGITLASARAALAAFKKAHILVHAYLMYAFPTETEAEARGALAYVRDRFAAGEIQSAFFHRFALTIHSPIAADPARFGIALRPLPPAARRFALNEIFYDEPGAPDWDRIGRALRLALYNYMLGLGLDLPVNRWFVPQKLSR